MCAPPPAALACAGPQCPPLPGPVPALLSRLPPLALPLLPCPRALHSAAAWLSALVTRIRPVCVTIPPHPHTSRGRICPSPPPPSPGTRPPHPPDGCEGYTPTHLSPRDVAAGWERAHGAPARLAGPRTGPWRLLQAAGVGPPASKCSCPSPCSLPAPGQGLADVHATSWPARHPPSCPDAARL